VLGDPLPTINQVEVTLQRLSDRWKEY
jgi:hypothetical protein